MLDHDLNPYHYNSNTFQNYEQSLNYDVYYDPEIFTLFHLITDFKRFATGKALFCNTCNKLVYSKEVFFECKNKFIVTVIRCITGCGANWRFHLPLAPKNDIEYLT